MIEKNLSTNERKLKKEIVKLLSQSAQEQGGEIKSNFVQLKNKEIEVIKSNFFANEIVIDFKIIYHLKGKLFC